jgi:hypothetical protein
MDVNKLTKTGSWFKRSTVETKVGTGAEAVSTGEFSCTADPKKAMLGLQIRTSNNSSVMKCFSVDKLDLSDLKTGDKVRVGNDAGTVTAAQLPR